MDRTDFQDVDTAQHVVRQTAAHRREYWRAGEILSGEVDRLGNELDAARARIAELGLPDDAAPRNPLDLPDRAEVWVRCRLKNRGDSPDVQPIGSDQRVAFWAALDPREPLTVLAAEHPRLIYGHPGGVWHYADEPCVCPGTPHDPTRE